MQNVSNPAKRDCYPPDAGHNSRTIRYQGVPAGVAGARRHQLRGPKLKRPGCSIALLIGISAVCFAGVASGQESLDRGKSPAQLFASHCSACHKSPQGLAKSGGLFGIEGFLREHYMTSRETAV